jgi:hypothetical protein
MRDILLFESCLSESKPNHSRSDNKQQKILPVETPQASVPASPTSRSRPNFLQPPHSQRVNVVHYHIYTIFVLFIVDTKARVFYRKNNHAFQPSVKSLLKDE